MNHIFEQRAYFSDTDAYGVVWHGAYLRWLEMGRVGLCEQMGHTLMDLKQKDIVLPVVNLNLRYKASAKLDDEMIIETELVKYSALSATFHQVIKSAKNNTVFVDGMVDIVAVNNEGKLYRKLPEILKEAFEKAVVCQELV